MLVVCVPIQLRSTLNVTPFRCGRSMRRASGFKVTVTLGIWPKNWFAHFIVDRRPNWISIYEDLSAHLSIVSGPSRNWQNGLVWGGRRKQHNRVNSTPKRVKGKIKAISEFSFEGYKCHNRQCRRRSFRPPDMIWVWPYPGIIATTSCPTNWPAQTIVARMTN